MKTISVRLKQIFVLFSLYCVPIILHASFIEATIGTAVVNDATATLHNPAALTLVHNPQGIVLGSFAHFQSRFNGFATQRATGLMQSGSSSASSNYFLPSIYLNLPANERINLGLAIVSNFFNRDLDDSSILRYVQSANQIQDIDFVTSLGMKLNKLVSIGAGLTLSHAQFTLLPVSGFPSLNIPDALSRNEASGNSWGGDVGILFTPGTGTLIGFNYRSTISYQLHGKSSLPQLTASNYRFSFWAPARSVFTISHFVSPRLGLISTVQRIQTSIIKNVPLMNVATLGPNPIIIPSTSIPFHLRNIWLLTLGSQYRLTPKCIVRAAGTYYQSPSNPNYQIDSGDSWILGASIGYELSKRWIIDASYAHAFIQNQSIHIATLRNVVTGSNTAMRDAVSLKLTMNI